MLRFFLLLVVASANISCSRDSNTGLKTKNKTTVHTSIDDGLVEAKSKIKPRLTSSWGVENYPGVIVCDDFVSIEEVKRSIRFWAKIGYKFRSVRNSINFYECSSRDPIPGHIRIRLLKSDDKLNMNNKIAITIVEKYLSSNLIVGVDIVGQGFMIKKELSLEHEIGHALGWDHVFVEDHIMHPEWVKIGGDADGLNYNDYEEQTTKMLFGL